MFKFGSIGAFSNAINIPYCKLSGTAEVRNGNAVTIDRAAKTMALTTADTGKGDVYVVYNVERRFEYDDSNEMCWKPGEMPLVYELRSLIGYAVDFTNDAQLIAGAPAAGNLLAYGADGKLTIVSAATGYKALYKVIEVVGDIIRAEVVAGE